MCIGWLLKSLYFVQVKLILESFILQTSPEWTIHSIEEVESWSDNFLNIMEEFTKLSEIERESNKQKLMAEPLIDIDLGDDTCFDTF